MSRLFPRLALHLWMPAMPSRKRCRYKQPDNRHLPRGDCGDGEVLEGILDLVGEAQYVELWSISSDSEDRGDNECIIVSSSTSTTHDLDGIRGIRDGMLDADLDAGGLPFRRGWR